MNLQRKNYEIIADELRRLIESSVVQPGDKLETIDRLAARYRVGRSTVREALSHLKALGLVESRQGGGTYVRRSALAPVATLDLLQTSGAELKQILQVRRMLEVGAAELAAQNRTEAAIRELGQIVEEMRIAIGDEEISQIHDTNFHLAIARASGNPILEDMMSHISATLFRTIQDSRKLWLYSEKETADKLFEEHQSIFQAIRSQNAQDAAAAMIRHLGRVEDALRLRV